MGMNLGEIFLRGGWVMWPLLVFSILNLAVLLERAWVFLSFRPKARRLTRAVMVSLESGDVSAAKQVCRTEPGVLAEVFLGPLETSKGRESAERVTERNRVRMGHYLKRNLWVLGTIGSAAPFVGLLGTVIGIVRSFHDMAEKGAGGFTVVAGGISEALYATAFGLVVAIMALLTYNVFVTASNQILTAVKLTVEEMLDQTFSKS